MTLLTAVVAAALAAGADGAPDGGSMGVVQKALDQAKAALDDGDFDTCLKKVDFAAERTYEDQPLAQVYLMRGRCLAALQRFGEVDEAFTHALEHDPDARLDPKRVLPALVVRLDDLRQRLRGSIEISVKPAGGRVWLDGYYVGTAPLRHVLTLGKHQVRARSLDDQATAKDEAIIRPNQTTRLVLSLVSPGGVGTGPVDLTPPEPALRVGADVEGAFDPINGYVLGGGAVVRGKYWYAAARAAVGITGSLELQLGARLPNVAGPVSLYAGADGQLLFLSNGSSAIAPGVGGAVGLSVAASSRVEVFAEGGGRQYLGLPTPQSSFLTLSTGLRVYFL